MWGRFFYLISLRICDSLLFEASYILFFKRLFWRTIFILILSAYYLLYIIQFIQYFHKSELMCYAVRKQHYKNNLKNSYGVSVRPIPPLSIIPLGFLLFVFCSSPDNELWSHPRKAVSTPEGVLSRSKYGSLQRVLLRSCLIQVWKRSKVNVTLKIKMCCWASESFPEIANIWSYWELKELCPPQKLRGSHRQTAVHLLQSL